LSKIEYSLYTKSLIKDNDKFSRFLNSTSQQSVKTAQIYSIGLSHFARFLNGKYKYTLNRIVNSLIKQEINVYDVLEDFLHYLISLEPQVPNTDAQGRKLSPRSIRLYVNAVRSYLQYNDVDIIPHKFKRRVKIPKILRYEEQPIDAQDIRTILNSCNSERLKAYLLVLASSGCRTIEAVAIRFKDIDFDSIPTKVHIRPEFSKTRVGRDIYISNEATKYLKDWIEYRFRDRKRKEIPKYEIQDNDLVFKFINNRDATLTHIYYTISRDFNDVLKSIKMDSRKEGMLRRKITLVSFRRFVKTVLSTQVSQDYSEYFLGHAKSSYWQMKQDEKRQIYVDKCMRYLTFLDYATVQTVHADFKSQLEDRDRQIEELSNIMYDYQYKEQQEKQILEQLQNKLNNIEEKIKKGTETLERETKKLKKERMKS